MNATSDEEYTARNSVQATKSNLRGSWVISDWEKKDAEEYKKIAAEAKEAETKERALYEYLKKKYEG